MGIAISSIAANAASEAPTTVDFLREVRPILAGHCFKCHGPDENARKAKLRLDVREEALLPAKSGQRRIVPGKPDESELVTRIDSTDDNEIMPPPETKHPLSAKQKEILKQWIAAGAEYTPHWAFVPPKQVSLPKVKTARWPRNAIDYFILARLEQEGLRPAPPADQYTLVRRVYLDLIGLPPTPKEADAFVLDHSPEAYDKLVDHLLNSPHYGERWARRWLDLARYADTNGYEKDRRRSIWPYRDWVIHAFNRDLPFDQFTIEQIAGDLLPNATLAQRIATGFHRNTMLNEEGGIDPLEFRFHAMVDRVNTTATAWLGLTLGCAQCHTHKYDPIAQREYYQFMAFLNNADEPEIEIPNEKIAARRADLETQIAALTRKLPEQFPPEELRWHTFRPVRFRSASGASARLLEDSSVRFSGENPERDTYLFEFETDLNEIAAIQLEALADPELPKKGLGRSKDGEAALSEITVTAAPSAASDRALPVNLADARARFSVKDRSATNAVDGNPKTGWLLKRPRQPGVPEAAFFTLERPLSFDGGTRWTIRLEQQAGKQQTLGRVRISFGTLIRDDRPLEVRRRDHLERKFKTWSERERARAVPWTPLRPVEAKSNLPMLTILDDHSVLASGDQSKRDLYAVKLRNELRGVTAIRLEALPDERLPKHGPGRVYYEGPSGDFFLSEVTLKAGGRPVPVQGASQSFASGDSSAQAALDGDPQTGWSINGGQGRAHTAVFNLAAPLDGADSLEMELLFERYHAAGLGRFRISATADARTAVAWDVPNDIYELLLVGTAHHVRATPASHEPRFVAGQDAFQGVPNISSPAHEIARDGVESVPPGLRQGLSEPQRRRLLEYFVSIAPELVDERQEIEELRRQRPEFPTTLIMMERPPENPRPTYVQNRGEFLQPKDRVEPVLPAVLPPLPQDAPRNRLSFARWLVDARNPLTGRVVMNREWAAFFGSGLARTVADFGFQGELPTHPELLDWLAVELVHQGWSLKKMHRLIVTSATYRQSSQATAELLQKDPLNRWLARGPRFRIEAELIRDAALRRSGLLSPKLGGPSVFPPQPPGVTTEGTYGPLPWNISEGGDRYRRGLYTFSKRTAPYAMFTTFDAPTGEACVARREVSNTPLQSLTLLNDTVFVEAAQSLGRRIAGLTGTEEAKAVHLFRRVLTRPPERPELETLLLFYRAQKQRLEAKKIDAATLAGSEDGNTNERAAWTLAARALLNLDEAVTKS